jgi:hypothetical protein
MPQLTIQVAKYNTGLFGALRRIGVLMWPLGNLSIIAEAELMK